MATQNEGWRPTSAPVGAAATLTPTKSLPRLPTRSIQSALSARRPLHLETPRDCGNDNRRKSINLSIPRPSGSPRDTSGGYTTNTLSGFTRERNAYALEHWQLLNSTKGTQRDLSSFATSMANGIEQERQHKQRAAEFTKSLNEINDLMEEKKRTAVKKPEVEEVEEAPVEIATKGSARRARDAHAALVAEKSKAMRARLPEGRVFARIEAYREDAALRADLESRVAAYKQVERKKQARDYVRENKREVQSTESLMHHKALVSQLYATRHEQARQRLDAQNAAYEQQRNFLRMSCGLERDRSSSADDGADAEILRVSMLASVISAAGGMSSSASAPMLGHTPMRMSLSPAERARLAAVTRARRQRWSMVCVHAQFVLRLFEQLKYRKMRAQLCVQAAILIQKARAVHILRVRLARIRRSMQLLRRNMGILVRRWRLRKKIFAADTVSEFLIQCGRKAATVKAVRKFVIAIKKIQRWWRRYAYVLQAQMTTLVKHLDRQLMGGKTPENFLSNTHKRAWLILVDGKTPVVVQSHGGHGMIQAAEMNISKAKGKSRKSKAEALLRNKRMFLIDMDVKMEVLARNLRKRKKAFVSRLREHRMLFLAADEDLQRRLARERVRRSIVPRSSMSESVTLPDKKDVTVPDAPKMPRFQLFLQRDQLHEVVSEALLLTAERIAQGLPIDIQGSMQKKAAKRRKRESTKERESTKVEREGVKVEREATKVEREATRLDEIKE
ncbi:hypothetical protein AB1Y20_009372 [Prymnesium parvum]|uniref:Uncharacterized protein n=1 Tax=Prymnesium parvum TaxID=97485 RepID=A0AB34K4V8_PRYPA